MKKAKGTETPSGKRQIAVTFEPELFDRLAQEAAATGLAFSELVRVYLKLGMQKMKWVLVITALVSGQPYHTAPLSFPSREACMAALKQAEQHPLYKAYNAKASCEKQ